uniref:Uncharacterized protein n=1 Tax=Oryza punctata TaxID=4537 RepID=A0A0E0KZ59_ORYPU
MAKIMKVSKPFKEEYEQLLEEAQDDRRQSGCIVNVLAVHVITPECHEVIVDSTGDDDVSAPPVS